MSFHLVQRLQRLRRPGENVNPFGDPIGLNRPRGAELFRTTFGIDYMGSTEFELGAVPKAWEVMDALKLELRPVEIERTSRGKVTTRTVYVVAEAATFDDQLVEFREWISHGMSGKERTYFDNLFDETDWLGDPLAEDDTDRDTIAWWSLRDNFAWTLDEELAPTLLEAFRTPEPTEEELAYTERVIEMDAWFILVGGENASPYGFLDRSSMFVWTSQEMAKRFVDANGIAERDPDHEILERAPDEVLSNVQEARYLNMLFDFLGPGGPEEVECVVVRI